MRRVSRSSKIVLSLGTAALLVAATAPAVASAAAAPPLTADPAPSTATTDGTTPMASSTAAQQAGAAYEQSASTGGSVPIVTVEKTATGPRIVSHRVSSASQARAVAAEAAKGNDLVVVAPDTVVRPVGGPTNDTYSASEWGISPAKTTFASAWKVSTGLGITVAVVDTGVDSSHPDLAGKVLPGRAFLNGNSTGVAMSTSTDTCGHGTHVAGTIAAIPNNFLGVAGAAPDVQILPVKVLNCSGYSSDVANGIKWAADNGARVINLSVGGPGPDPVLAAAVKYARDRKAVVVAAAGNNHGPASCSTGNNVRSYPGSTPGAIGVGAIDQNYNRACFSNTGDYVDLVGPGYNVLSTYPLALTPKGYAPYMYMSGTSMATPHVSAAAALVLARKPSCTPDQVEQKLESTAIRLGGTTRNNSFGWGLIDPAKAVATLAC